MTDEIDVTALPVDERMYYALVDAGFDEDEAQESVGVVSLVLSADLRRLADEVEWKHRSMTFMRDGDSTTSLHRSGEDIRAYASIFAPITSPEEASRG